MPEEGGTFIVLEGPDGCGKSSMVEAVRRHLAARGRSAVFVHDPGGTAVGDALRAVLLDPRHEAMCPVTELLLYLASRAQLVAEVIAPALARGEAVVADRFYHSTLVYQGEAGAVPETTLRDLVRLGLDAVVPDRVILLDLSAEEGLGRVGGDRDRMERKGAEYLRGVRTRYLALAEAEEEAGFVVVDAARPLAEVERDVLEEVDAVLG